MERLKQVFVEIIQFLDNMIQVEKKKFQAAVNNNIMQIDECVNEEQVLMLKLRGIDKKREALQKELGYERMALKEMMEALPETPAEDLNEVIATLNAKYRAYKECYSQAQKAIELNLHTINKKLDALHVGNVVNKTYKEDGEVVLEMGSFTNRRV